MLRGIGEFLQPVRDDIKNGENLDSYVAIAIALVLTVLSVFGFSKTSALFGGLFATLTVLVFNSLRSRRDQKNLRILVDSKNSPSRVLTPLRPLSSQERALIPAAARMSVSGTSLYRLLPAYEYEIQEMLAAGGILRVLLSRPSAAITEMAALRSKSGASAALQAERIDISVELVRLWKSQHPKAHVELKLINYACPFGITVIEPRARNDKAYCLVRLTTFRTPSSTPPSLNPDPIEDKYLYDFFTGQFENMWECIELEELIPVDAKTEASSGPV